jgi:hypothetical protein
MELLRRALLVGCVLPGLWLLRLAPLDPLLSVVPVDFAAIQKQEAARVPDDRKTEEQRRRAEIPLPVYIEEALQYNIFSASGPRWSRLLQDIDGLTQGARAARPVFLRSDEDPIREVLDKLAAGGGTTYVSMSRPGEDRHYRVERRSWTRNDFRPGAGFTGAPPPPAALLYPFRLLGLGLILAGLVFFALLPGSKQPRARSGLTRPKAGALLLGLAFFAGPLALVGGSVQALTRASWLTLPCWVLAAAAIHLFAGPGRNAPDLGRRHQDAPVAFRALFLREGFAFLAMALGPLAFLISASIILWNR